MPEFYPFCDFRRWYFIPLWQEISPIEVASTATAAFVGGSVVVAGLASLAESGSAAVGSGAFSMMTFGLEQLLLPCSRSDFPHLDEEPSSLSLHTFHLPKRWMYTLRIETKLQNEVVPSLNILSINSKYMVVRAIIKRGIRVLWLSWRFFTNNKRWRGQSATEN